MAHRDDLDAALAHIAALERELGDTERALAASEHDSDDKTKALDAMRAELETLRARVAKDKDKGTPRTKLRAAKPRDEPPRERGLGRFAPVGLLGGAIACVLLVYFVVFPSCARRASRTKAGTVASLDVLPDANGTPRLLLQTRVSYNGFAHQHFRFWRVDIIEAASGKRLSRFIDEEPNGGHLSVVQGPPGKLWFVYDNRRRFEVRSARDLSLLHGFARFSAAAPKLATSIHGPIRIEPNSRALVITLLRGSRVIAHASGTVRPFKQPTARLDSLASYGSTTTHAVNINGGASMYFARKDGSPRRGLALGGTKAPLPGAADLLEPKFITERNTHRALVLPGDGGFLIKRYPTLGKHETMLVSRLRRDGTLGWSREMPDANISWAKLVGARLVLVRGGAQILGIEPKSGKIAWRYQP